jgi:hypothetical protein
MLNYYHNVYFIDLYRGIYMTIHKGFRKRSRKKSLAGKAFEQNKGELESDVAADSSGSSGRGKAGDVNLRRRLFGKKFHDSSLNELAFLVQLGDLDALQLLTDRGYDAKDSLSLSSLEARVLGGDYDALRILRDKKGIDLEKRARENIGSHLRNALLSATHRIRRMSNAVAHEKQPHDKTSALPVTRQ